MRRQNEPAELAAERKRAAAILRKAGMSAAAIRRAIGQIMAGAKPVAAKGVERKIARIVAHFVDELRSRDWQITVADIVSDRKFRSIVAPRMVAMLLVREILGAAAPLAVIGLFFGGRDHSTVIHAIANGAHEQMRRDERLRLAVNATKRKLAGRRDV